MWQVSSCARGTGNVQPPEAAGRTGQRRRVATVVTDAQLVHGSGSELTLKEMVDFLQQQLGLSDKFNVKQIVDAACEQLGVPADSGNLLERARVAHSKVC